VTKHGSVTGITRGKIVHVVTITNKNNNNPMVVVEWEAGKIFAVNGDCGSLYYCEGCGEEGNIPVAIHIFSAKMGNKKYSFGAIVESLQFEDNYSLSWEIPMSQCRNFLEFDYASCEELEDVLPYTKFIV